MLKQLLAFVIIAGACCALPHNDQSTIVQPESPVHPERGPVKHEDGPVNPERGAFNPEKGPVDPEKGLVDPERVLVDPNVPVKAPEDIPALQDGPKSDSDLKTDSTFWWPYYRSYWTYPTYRTYSYNTYPYHRYYRPRAYYTSYDW